MEKFCVKKNTLSLFFLRLFIRTFEKNLEDTITRCKKH